MDPDNNHLDVSQILEKLKNLESRVNRIERRFHIENSVNNKSNIESEDETNEVGFKIDEYWFANIGIILMVFCIAFILAMSFHSIPQILPALFGLTVASSAYFLSNRWQKSFPSISRVLAITSIVLLYFSTLRLFHFNENPALTGKILETVLLLIVSTAGIALSIRIKNSFLAGLSITLILLTALLNGNSYIIFLFTFAGSILFVISYLKFNLQYSILYGIFAVYFTHFIWAINNPIFGNKITIIGEPRLNLIFIIFYNIVFLIGIHLNRSSDFRSASTIAANILNTLGCFFLFQFVGLISYKNEMLVFDLILFAVFFFVAIILFRNKKDKYSIAAYSLTGYMAMSIALIVSTNVPLVYNFLIWQSIFVLCTAIWFQSKNIVVANFGIFITIFFAFFLTANSFGIISISFGIVALISARVLSWQKDKLTIKTEFIRNSYLVIAFISIPYTLLKSLPPNYIGISWLSATLLYYLMSIWLKNTKYAWMANSTLIASVIYIFFVGFPSLNTTFNLINIFSLILVLIVSSIAFIKINNKKKLWET